MEEYTYALSKALEKASKPLRRRVVRQLLNLLKKDGSRQTSGRSQMENGLKVLRKMFKLSEPEIRLVEFMCLITTWENLENYFVVKLSTTTLPGRKYLAAALDLTPEELNGALTGILERIDFFSNEEMSGGLTSIKTS